VNESSRSHGEPDPRELRPGCWGREVAGTCAGAPPSRGRYSVAEGCECSEFALDAIRGISGATHHVADDPAHRTPE
jgi:hypothetical protein